MISARIGLTLILVVHLGCATAASLEQWHLRKLEKATALVDRDAFRRLRLESARITVAPGVANPQRDSMLESVVLSERQRRDFLRVFESRRTFALEEAGCISYVYEITVTMDGVDHVSDFCPHCRLILPSTRTEGGILEALHVRLSDKGARRLERFLINVLSARNRTR